MKIWNRIALVVACAAALFGNENKCFAQGSILYYNKVDSLSFGQRFSLRTNLAGWAELTPNVGFEFTLGNRNWSKWTLGVYGRANWKTKTTDLAYNVYDVYDGRVQLRKYWHGKGNRRVFYWGVYAGINKYDIKFNRLGYRGNGYTGGAMVGTISQLYGYKNGASLDLDLGLNAGVLFGSIEQYYRKLNADGTYSYEVEKPKESNKLITEPLPMIASMDLVHMGLVYHFGTRVANRYKKRIEVDDAYRIMLANRKMQLDSLDRAHRRMKAIKRDSLAEVDYEKRFNQQRQDIEEEYQKREQELLKQRDQFLKEEKEAEEKKNLKAEAEKKTAE